MIDRGSWEGAEGETVEIRVMRDYMELIAVDAECLFRDKAFVEWLNSRPDIASWHTQGTPPHEHSDIFMYVNFPWEGSDYGGSGEMCMPEHCWQFIMDALMEAGVEQDTELIVWLRNL